MACPHTDCGGPAFVGDGFPRVCTGCQTIFMRNPGAWTIDRL